MRDSRQLYPVSDSQLTTFKMGPKLRIKIIPKTTTEERTICVSI
jgi:hypothetical protein